MRATPAHSRFRILSFLTLLTQIIAFLASGRLDHLTALRRHPAPGRRLFVAARKGASDLIVADTADRADYVLDDGGPR